MRNASRLQNDNHHYIEVTGLGTSGYADDNKIDIIISDQTQYEQCE